MAAVGASAAGAVSGAGRGIAGILGMIFFNWRLTISLILILIYMGSAVSESFSTGSFKPLVFSAGMRILSSDEKLYWQINEIEKNDWKLPSKHIDDETEKGFFRDVKNIFAKAGFVFDVLSTIWFICMLIYLLYLALHSLNSAGQAIDIFLAIILVMLLQSLAGVSMLYLNYECSIDHTDKCLSDDDQYASLGFAMTPFKGIGTLIYNCLNGNLIDTFKQAAIPYPVPKNESVINQTNSTIV